MKKTIKNSFNKLITTIYFTNHQKRQLVDFLRKYSYTIYVNNYLECKFQKFTFE